MRWLSKISHRLHSVFAKAKAESELSAELQFHLEHQIEQNIADGMSPEQARYAALRELGGLAQVEEQCRESRGVRMWECVVQDIRFGFRGIRKSPAFALVVIGTLALGIGANTAIFSFVDRLLLRPLPYNNPDRLVVISDISSPKGALVEFGQRLRSLDLAAFSVDMGFNLSGDGEAIRVNGTQVTSNLLPMLGVKPELGRVFIPGDEKPGKSRLVILSHSLWQKKFGGDPHIVGRFLTLEDVRREVVGVMPPDFHFPNPRAELWVPIEMNTADRSSMWGPFQYMLMGRLRPVVTLSAARAEFKAVLPQAIKAYPWPMGDKYASWADLKLVSRDVTGKMRTELLILLGAVGLVLLIACANVANLLLARSANREREMSIRAAMGASRSRITAQLLTESCCLALLGGVFGVVLAFLTQGILAAFLPLDSRGLQPVPIDSSSNHASLLHHALAADVLLFSAGISILTGLAFGLMPAWRASRTDVEQSLRANSLASSSGRAKSRLTSGLVVFEIALAVVLVSGAGLLMKSLWKLSRQSVGFDSQQTLTAQITPTSSFCKQHSGCVDFYRNLLANVRALPGVKQAAITDGLPLTGFPATGIAVEDRPSFSVHSPFQVWEFSVSPGYFAAMGIPLLRGRDFNDNDDPFAPGVVLVSRVLARTLWPGQDPIGKRLKPSWEKQWRTVVGVVDDVAIYKSVQGDPTIRLWVNSIYGQVYFPAAQGIIGPIDQAFIAMRTQPGTDLTGLSQQLKELVAQSSVETPVSEIVPMERIVYDSVATPRSTMWLFVSFAMLALALGITGIYSVMSYSVSQRTREIGIRMAMGARRADVMRIILRRGSLLTAVGLMAGSLASLALTRTMASLLDGVRPADPGTLIPVALVVGTAALAATIVPCRRAMRVDPNVALKYE